MPLFTASLYGYLKVSTDEVLISGQTDRPCSVEGTFAPDLHNYAFRLAPGTIRLLFGVPADEFTGELIPARLVRGLHPPDFSPAGGRSPVLIAAALRRAMARRGLEDLRNRALVRTVVMRLKSTAGVNVNEVADEFGFSVRHMQRILTENAGFNFQKLRRIVRFEKVKQLLRTQRNLSWSEIAQRSDYYDQSHFIRDFEAFTGLSPSRFFSSMSDSSNTWA